MNETLHRDASADGRSAAPTSALSGARSGSGWERPSFEVISLSCEISAYAPDGDDSPLF